MSDESALLAAVHAHPLDDAPRLVYADWLDEQGGGANAARAEFIRVQCELELLSADDPRYAPRQKRERALLRAWKSKWLRPLKKYGKDVEFSRGFPVPSLADFAVGELTKLTEPDLRAAPLWRYESGLDDDELAALLRWPQLHRLTTFSLSYVRKPGWAGRIARCDGLRNVTELSFYSGGLTVAGLRAILDAWTGRRLRVLLVNQSSIGDAGVRLIARHPATAGLRVLYAHSVQCTAGAMEAVAAGPNLDRLTLATFAHNRLGATGGRHLLRWKALAGIGELYLMNTKMSERVKAEFRERLGDRVKI